MSDQHRIIGIRRTAVVVGLLAGLAGCTEQPTSSPDGSGPELAQGGPNGGGGGAKPKVTSTDPTEAPQGVTLDVRVLGSGYDFGSSVRMLLDGKVVAEVMTNTTTFVSDTELVANITIALDADTAAYDVEVLTSRKRRGIGTEMFSVRLSGGPPPEPIVGSVTISGGNQLSGDEAGPYVGEVCGVLAERLDNITFRPVSNRLSKKEQRELPGQCQDYPRSAQFDLANAVVHAYCKNPSWDVAICGTVDPGHHGPDKSLGQLMDELELDAFSPVDAELRRAAVRLLSTLADEDEFLPGGFNLPFCLGDNGTGRPFRFDAERNLYSNDLVVDTLGTGGTFPVRTQPFPNNVGSCAHQESGTGKKGGDWYVFLLHMDLAYDYADLP